MYGSVEKTTPLSFGKCTQHKSKTKIVSWKSRLIKKVRKNKFGIPACAQLFLAVKTKDYVYTYSAMLS